MKWIVENSRETRARNFNHHDTLFLLFKVRDTRVGPPFTPLLAIIYNGLWQLWLVLARHFSERAERFRSNRLAWLTPFVALPMRGVGTDMVCHGTSGSRTPYSQAPISTLSELQIPLKYRTTLAYNWDLGINVSVKTQKCSDNFQNMRIMRAVLRFKKWEKLF